MKKGIKYLSTKEIQEEEIKILEILLNFFKQNNLNYFIWAGTYLGAVRHKGFIPWDDDIDLAMIRPEYEKLIDILKNNNNKISDDIWAISYELGNSDFPFLKIINKNIRVEEEEKCDEYLWIDIFPLDATPKNNKRFWKKVNFYKTIFSLKRNQKNNVKMPYSSLSKKFLKKIFINILRIWKYDDFLRFYYKLCTKYDYDKYEYVHNNVWSSSKEVYHKSELINKSYSFENLKLNGLENYDYILTKGYGDYMTLPPEDQRKTHNIKVWRVK